ncbi:MAG TPA: contractile injection system protein, VgrG/Pvc8 family, partial [Minicystis sp.]|nr:contractile injection system protein, VgrG/Pvc8 family [Minicystis sp.]
MTTADDTAARHATLEIDGAPIEVTRVTGREAAGEAFRYDATCVAPSTDVDPTALIGKDAALALGDGFGGARTVRGIVAEAETRVSDAGRAALFVTLRPKAFVLTTGRDSRVFHDASAIDIAREVLARRNVPARFDVASGYAKRVFTAQYRESDWALVFRLLEEEGVYAWFDHEA